MKNCKITKVLVFITICVNTLLLLIPLYLYYCYNFTDKLFLFMYPNLVLLINALFGIVGMSISIMLYREIISTKLFLIVTLILWLVSLSNYFFPIY
jgi:hypothetical protein